MKYRGILHAYWTMVLLLSWVLNGWILLFYHMRANPDIVSYKWLQRSWNYRSNCKW